MDMGASGTFAPDLELKTQLALLVHLAILYTTFKQTTTGVKKMKGCRVLEAHEISELLASLSIRDRVLALTGLTFGTRISETLALTWGDVRGAYLYLNSAKGSEKITFQIPASYRAALVELEAYYVENGRTLDSETPLFLSRKGVNQSITRQQASDVMKAACATLGIDGKVNTHSMRKSFVTKIYELTGKDIAQTKTYSRHKSMANLDYYIQTTAKTDLINQLAW